MSTKNRNGADPADLEELDLLEYRLAKVMDEAVFEGFPATVDRINEGGPGITVLTDDTARLPNGTIVMCEWTLKVLNPQEARSALEEAIEELEEADPDDIALFMLKRWVEELD